MVKGSNNLQLRAAKTWRYPAVGSPRDRARRVWQRARNFAGRMYARVTQGGIGFRPQECLVDRLPSVPRIESENLSSPALMNDAGSVTLRPAYAGRAVDLAKNEVTRTIQRRYRGQPHDGKSISELTESFELAFATLEKYARDDVEMVLHNLEVARVLIEREFSEDLVIGGVLLGLDARVITNEVGAAYANAVEGVTSLKQFCYDPAMEPERKCLIPGESRISIVRDDRGSRYQEELVTLARIREVPNMDSHILAAISCYAELKMASERMRKVSGATLPSPAVETQAVAHEAYYLHVEFLGRWGYGILAAELKDLATEALDYGGHQNFRQERVRVSGLPREQKIRLLNNLQSGITSAIGNDFKIYGRVKTDTSAYEKVGLEYAKAQGKKTREDAFIEAGDDLAFRLTCSRDEECYDIEEAVTRCLIAEGFEVDLEKRDDYIANPKANGYRSLHLHFRRVDESGRVITLEIQVRTFDMDLVAEWGSASHWRDYKAGLAGSEAVEFDAMLREMGPSAEETRVARWNKLADLATRYAFAYEVGANRRGRPPKVDSRDKAGIIGRLGWENTGVLRVYTGLDERGNEVLPYPLDIAISLSNIARGVYRVHYYDEQNGTWVSSGEARTVPNGGIVYIERKQIARVARSYLELVNLPSSKAAILATTLAAYNGEPFYPSHNFPTKPGQIDAGRRIFEDRLAAASDASLQSADFPFVEKDSGTRVIHRAIYSDIAEAARRAGFSDLRVLWSLLYMFQGREIELDRIMQDYIDAHQAYAMHVTVVTGGTYHQVYMFPEMNCPGIICNAYRLLHRQGVRIEGIFEPTDTTKMRATRGNAAFYFLVSRSVDLVDKVTALEHGYRGLAPYPEGSKKQSYYRVIVEYPDHHRQILLPLLDELYQHGVDIHHPVVYPFVPGHSPHMYFDVRFHVAGYWRAEKRQLLTRVCEPLNEVLAKQGKGRGGIRVYSYDPRRGEPTKRITL